MWIIYFSLLKFGLRSSGDTYNEAGFSAAVENEAAIEKKAINCQS
jgi:hypothetical protein